MADVLDLPQALNPLASILYLVQGSLDKQIDFDDLVHLQHNQSVKFNSESITSAATAQFIDFTSRSGQVAYADASYMIIPFAFDVDGVLTPVKIPASEYAAGGFNIYNESGVVLTFNYFTIKL